YLQLGAIMPDPGKRYNAALPVRLLHHGTPQGSPKRAVERVIASAMRALGRGNTNSCGFAVAINIADPCRCIARSRSTFDRLFACRCLAGCGRLLGRTAFGRGLLARCG